MTELQAFDGDRVSRVDFEKNVRVKVFGRFQSKIKHCCIFSSNSFLNNNYYIIDQNIYIFFYLIFVIKNKNKDAKKHV